MRSGFGMRRVCFVTNELYPMAPGGIGRLMYNFRIANDRAGRPVEMHYLFPASFAPRLEEIQAALGDSAVAHVCPPPGTAAGVFPELAALLDRSGWDHRRAIGEALDYHFGLIEAERRIGGPFDVIEFPDYGGWAYVALQAKAAGLRFRDSRIAVRLHSTFGLISAHEPYYHRPSAYLAALCDQERYCLAKADIVVGHLASIARCNAEHYGFDAEWLARVVIEFPPILLDDALLEIGQAAQPDGQPPCFVFSSRLQPFKRPDRLINAAARLARDNPALDFTAQLVSYGWDENYIAHLRSLVPPDLAERITIWRDRPAEERNAVLARGIIVVPSDYESLCLFAYEAAQLGRPVILSRDCTAFGQGPRWVDGVNCLMFDGDFPGLAETMRRALEWRPSAVVDATPDTPYWETLPPAPPPPAPAPRAAMAARGRIRIVAHGFASPETLSAFMLRLAHARLLGAEVTVLLPEHATAAAPGLIATLMDAGHDIRPTTGIELRPAELQETLALLPEPHVLLLPGEYMVLPAFMEAALRCLDANPEADLVSAHVRRTDAAGRSTGFEVFMGGLPSLALRSPLVAPPAAVLRRETALRLGFDERARGHWWSEFSRRLVGEGGEVHILQAPLLDFTGTGPLAGTTPPLDATVADRVGLRAGLPERLLAVDASAGGDPWQSEPFEVMTGPQLRYGRRLLPADWSGRNWEPVCFRDDLGAFQVHPLGADMTLAAIELLPKRPVRFLRCRLRNAHADNAGFEVCLAASQEPQPMETLLRMGQLHAPEGLPRSNWERMPAGRTLDLSLALPAACARPRLLYVATRLSPGSSDRFVWAVLDRIEFH
jgi:glycosyltransferase involved in cell wall biosynthesis